MPNGTHRKLADRAYARIARNAFQALSSSKIWERALTEIHPDVVLSALAEVDGETLEKFFKEFGAGVFGLNFTPLGGVHDGGADGFSEEEVYETERKFTYFQASKEANHRSKIKRTIDRIKEFGRTISNLNYFTSRIIGNPDIEALELSHIHNVNITIYDGQWIANRINASPITRSAFENYLRYFSGLKTLDRRNSAISMPADVGDNAAAFIAQHAIMSSSKDGIRGVVLDSLILFTLEEATLVGTPFITSIEIYERMRERFPAGFNFSDEEAAQRIALLSTRDHPYGKQIVWDERKVGYALPYPARSAIYQEHAAFESLIFRVREEFRASVVDIHEDVDVPSKLVESIVDSAMKSLEILFMDEGLKVAQFLDGGDEDISEATVADIALRALKAEGVTGRHAPKHFHALMEIMRRVFYQTSEDQREYLSYLSRTYALLFSLKYDLKISKYFSDMRSNFQLLVGADVMIQALSESRLPEKDRATHGMIRALRASGADLVLTDYVVDEVYTHIVAANEEYVNHYAEQDKYMSLPVAKQSDRILIRAYFYAKLAPATEAMRVDKWSHFVEQFLPYAEIRTAEARIALRTYLREKFGLRLETRDEIRQTIKEADLNKLSRSIMREGIKDRKELADNDAAHVLYVYALRNEGNEIARSSPVGYRTWWLTNETRIQKTFANLVAENGKAIMRPQVAIQLLSFAPNADEVRLAYGNIMPSLVGVRLGNRSHPAVLRRMLDKVEEVSKGDPARLKAEMERLTNKLKSNEDDIILKSLDLQPTPEGLVTPTAEYDPDGKN